MKVCHLAPRGVCVVPYGWVAYPMTLKCTEADGRAKKLVGKAATKELLGRMVCHVQWTVYCNALKDALAGSGEWGANAWAACKGWNNAHYIEKSEKEPALKARRQLHEEFTG